MFAALIAFLFSLGSALGLQTIGRQKMFVPFRFRLGAVVASGLFWAFVFGLFRPWAQEHVGGAIASGIAGGLATSGTYLCVWLAGIPFRVHEPG